MQFEAGSSDQTDRISLTMATVLWEAMTRRGGSEPITIIGGP